MGVHLGVPIYVSNQLSTPAFPMRAMAFSAGVMAKSDQAPPLSIEPRKVSREATVYAVFAIE
jgi:hypothetical protein